MGYPLKFLLKMSSRFFTRNSLRIATRNEYRLESNCRCPPPISSDMFRVFSSRILLDILHEISPRSLMCQNCRNEWMQTRENTKKIINEKKRKKEKNEKKNIKMIVSKKCGFWAHFRFQLVYGLLKGFLPKFLKGFFSRFIPWFFQGFLGELNIFSIHYVFNVFKLDVNEPCWSM